MRTGLRVEIRWCDTLLDVAYVEGGEYTLADVPIVRGGKLLGSAFGRVGQVTYVVEPVVLPPRSVRYGRTEDRKLAPYAAVALVAHLAVWAIATNHDPAEKHERPATRHVPTLTTSKRFALEKKRDNEDRSEDDKTPGRGTPMQLAPGISGQRIADRTNGHVAVARRADPAVARSITIEEARTAGILGSSPLASASFQAVVAHDDLTSGFDAATINAPPIGADNAAAGSFAFARTGFAEGGGGGSYGTIGVGRYGTWSNGTSEGHGWGTHGGGAASLRHDLHVPHIRICPRDCSVDGGLDLAHLRRYLKRNSSKLSYCYEKALLAKPGLAGTVRASFVIDDAKVLQVTASGVDPDVAACVATTIENIEFPAAPTTSASIEIDFSTP